MSEATTDSFTQADFRTFSSRCASRLRQYIVKTVANRDGGGHLDPKLPADYPLVSRGPGFGLSMRIKMGEDHRARDCLPAQLRRITWG